MKLEIKSLDKDKEEFAIRIFDSDGLGKSITNVKGRKEMIDEVNRLFLYIDRY